MGTNKILYVSLIKVYLFIFFVQRQQNFSVKKICIFNSKNNCCNELQFNIKNWIKIFYSFSLQYSPFFITLLPGGNSFRQPKNVVRSLTLVNILQMSWNWYMLFISDIAWTVLKMVYVRLMVCLQRHTKVFRYITVYGEKRFKA